MAKRLPLGAGCRGVTFTRVQATMGAANDKQDKPTLGQDAATYTPAHLPQPDKSKDAKPPMLGADPRTWTPAHLMPGAKK